MVSVVAAMRVSRCSMSAAVNSRSRTPSAVHQLGPPSTRGSRIAAGRIERRREVYCAQAPGFDANEEKQQSGLTSALENARRNKAMQMSPGAGLSSAEEQAEAAYADLIDTSLGDDGSLSAAELQSLESAGSMEGVTAEKRGGGLTADIRALFGALTGGAHIVRQKDGRV